MGSCPSVSFLEIDVSFGNVTEDCLFTSFEKSNVPSMCCARWLFLVAYVRMHGCLSQRAVFRLVWLFLWLFLLVNVSVSTSEDDAASSSCGR